AAVRAGEPVRAAAAGVDRPRLRPHHARLQPHLQPAGRALAAHVPPGRLRRGGRCRHGRGPDHVRPHPAAGPGMSAPAVDRPQALRRRRSGSLTHPHRTGFALVAPAVALVVVFVFVPLVVAVYISLTNFPLIGPYRFIGLDNYVSVVTDPTFWGSLGYTLLYTAIVTLPILLLGYGLAVLVRSNRRGATLLRTIFFVPFVIGLTTLSFLSLLEAQPNSGLINVVLKALGVTDGTTAWLVDGPAATGLLCVMVIWG